MIIFIFSCSTYLNSFEIAIYSWLGSNGDTTEFRFAFHGIITWNYIFEAANCRRIMLISLCQRNGSEGNLFLDSYLVSSRNAHSLLLGIKGVVKGEQPTAAEKSKVSMAPMHFICTQMFLDRREYFRKTFIEICLKYIFIYANVSVNLIPTVKGFI